LGHVTDPLQQRSFGFSVNKLRQENNTWSSKSSLSFETTASQNALVVFLVPFVRSLIGVAVTVGQERCCHRDNLGIITFTNAQRKEVFFWIGSHGVRAVVLAMYC
jgi:hypothetical protein